jgi:hypothetical protein
LRIGMNTRQILLAGVSSVSIFFAIGCAASPPCRQGAKDDLTVAGRTTGESVKTGAETGVEGVKTAGKAVGGLVKGGTTEAKEKWDEGKAETSATAHDDSAKVHEEADVPPCK